MSDPRCQRIQRSPARLACAGVSTTVIASRREIDPEDAAVVGGVGDAVRGGRETRAVGSGQLRDHLERAAFLRDAIDAAAFAVEHQDALGRDGDVGEAARPLVGRERYRCQDTARDQLQLVQRRRARLAGRAHDPQVALDRVNLEGRHLVEACVDAGEARQPAGPLADDEKPPVLAVSDDEAPRDRVVRETDRCQARRREDQWRRRSRRGFCLRVSSRGLSGSGFALDFSLLGLRRLGCCGLAPRRRPRLLWGLRGSGLSLRLAERFGWRWTARRAPEAARTLLRRTAFR